MFIVAYYIVFVKIATGTITEIRKLRNCGYYSY